MQMQMQDTLTCAAIPEKAIQLRVPELEPEENLHLKGKSAPAWWKSSVERGMGSDGSTGNQPARITSDPRRTRAQADPLSGDLSPPSRASLIKLRLAPVRHPPVRAGRMLGAEPLASWKTPEPREGGARAPLQG